MQVPGIKVSCKGSAQPEKTPFRGRGQQTSQQTQRVLFWLDQTDYFKVLIFILFYFLEMGFIFYSNISKG